MSAQQTIPRIIHLIYFRSEEPLPPVFEHCYQTIKALHPNWQVELYDSERAKTIIKHEMRFLYDIYTSYTTDVQRADILRVVLVYLYGGIYLDLDMECYMPLDKLLDKQLILAEEKTVTEKICEDYALTSKLRIANYAFGSIPCHHFWLHFLKNAIELSTMELCSENDILESTGPGLLTNIYQQMKHQFFDIHVLENKNKICIKGCEPKYSCHFGNYAAHLHEGTWRWNNRSGFSAIGSKTITKFQINSCINSLNELLTD